MGEKGANMDSLFADFNELFNLFFSFFSGQQGAVGLAIWVLSVANQSKDSEVLESRSAGHGYSSLLAAEAKNETAWRRPDGGDDLELSTVETGILQQGAINEEVLLDDLKV